MVFLGELTKLCAYGFQFMFHVLVVVKGRAWDDCITHTIGIPHMMFYSDFMAIDTLVLFECLDDIGIYYFIY